MRTPEENEWSDELMQSWPALIGSIPQAVIDAATKATQVVEGMYVAFMPEDASPTYYARAEPDSTQGPGFPYPRARHFWHPP